MKNSGIAELLPDAQVVTISFDGEEGETVLQGVPVLRANSYGVAVEHNGQEVVIAASIIRTVTVLEHVDNTRVTPAQISYGQGLEKKIHGDVMTDWENETKASAHAKIKELVEMKDKLAGL